MNHEPHITEIIELVNKLQNTLFSLSIKYDCWTARFRLSNQKNSDFCAYIRVFFNEESSSILACVGDKIPRKWIRNKFYYKTYVE